ncbi:MAG: hypothetical protein ACUVQ3_09050 [bacterium]
MRQSILFLIFCFILAWSTPNFDRFAQIICKDGGSGYIDTEGKLWILAIKWKTEKITQREGPYYVIKPNGKIDTIPGKEKSWDRQIYPYLYLSLYSKNGEKIKEQTLQDSVAGEGGVYFIPLKGGGGIVAARVSYDLLGIPDPTRGHVILILMDKEGNVKQIHRFLEQEHLYSLPHNPLVDYDGNIYLWLSGVINIKTVYIVIEDNKFHIEDPPRRPSPPFGVRNMVITEFLKGNIPFSCQQVDTFKIVGKWGDKYPRKDVQMEDYRFFQDSIQVVHYDFNTQLWQLRRYHIPSASFRKFVNFNLYPLRTVPDELIQDEPIYESARLKNDYIVVTVFMKEKNEPVAYQMLFDSIGNYIKASEIKTLKPKDISKIPDGSKMFIKSVVVPKSWSKGKYRATDVYIWGYGKDDGILYWKKYRID